ncbi:hypothetical protein C2S52_015432 [Perilla frutescens var. hirtella]|nr:hypothetical protein C2S52_015432 [Perilla frutescens var. hirtella]
MPLSSVLVLMQQKEPPHVLSLNHPKGQMTTSLDTSSTTINIVICMLFISLHATLFNYLYICCNVSHFNILSDNFSTLSPMDVTTSIIAATSTLLPLSDTSNELHTDLYSNRRNTV